MDEKYAYIDNIDNFSNEFNEDEPIITFKEIIKEIKRGIWIILYSTAIGVLLAAVGTCITQKDIYQAKSTVIMSKEFVDLFYSEQYTKSDVDLYQQVANTYIEISKSNEVMDKTIERLKEIKVEDIKREYAYTREEIKKIVSAKYREGTLIIEITAKSDSLLEVAPVANAYRESFSEVVKETLPIATLNVLDKAEPPKAPNDIGLSKNMILGAVGGMSIALLFIFIRMFIESTTIRKEDEIRALLGVEVLVSFK